MAGSAPSAASVVTTSPRRDAAPGEVSTARSPNTTTVSSTNTPSGWSSAGRDLLHRPAVGRERTDVALPLPQRELGINRGAIEVGQLTVGQCWGGASNQEVTGHQDVSSWCGCSVLGKPPIPCYEVVMSEQ